MGKPELKDGIEIAEDMSFQRRVWSVQRLGWVLMTGVVALALFGGFGRGYVSSRHMAANGSPLAIDYERFLRFHAPEQLTVYADSRIARPDSTIEIWLDRDWLTGVEVNHITPEPHDTRINGDRVIYSFRVDPGASAARFTYNLEVHSIGRIKGKVGVAGGPSYDFSQFAYP